MTRNRRPPPTLLSLGLLALVLAGGRLDGHPQRSPTARRGGAALPPDVHRETDIPYGPDPRQRFDVYSHRGARLAPVVFMVHGGAWTKGDKGASRVVENKVARWVPKGVVFVSTNYRLAPEADALAQVDDVARALVRAQAEAALFGGDRSRFVLMGHSAGAHLVALLAAAPDRALRLGALPWLGTVSLDSAALNVVEVMEGPHASFFDQAFGRDPAGWRAASPFHQLRAGLAPFLAVCSSRRRDSCKRARGFAARAEALGARARVLPEDLSHEEINERLGEESAYTRDVESFLGGLDPAFR